MWETVIVSYGIRCNILKVTPVGVDRWGRGMLKWASSPFST